MSYLPELRDSLLEAARRQHVAVSSQRRSRGSTILRRPSFMGWAATIVSVLLGLGGAAAVGVFRAGTPLGPEVRPSANAGEGVAIPSSVKLLPMRVTDPGGGPPWGLRILRTTRGLTCLQVGRVEFHTVGVLGEDGAFRDDGRFHPLSENLHNPFDCAVTDARGDGFLNVLARGFPASGLIDDAMSAGGCIPLHEHNSVLRLPRCPAAGMRDVYYGLLGPAAVSVTYQTARGGLVTSATGSDGAYLVVLPHSTGGCVPSHMQLCPAGEQGLTGGPELEPGAISAVRYGDGHVCHNPSVESPSSRSRSCPLVGFIALPQPRFTAAELATPIHVEKIPAKLYCEQGQTVKPCGAHTPRGVRRLSGGQPSLLVEISFTSRVAIPDTSSYWHDLSFPASPGCPAGGLGGPTSSDIRAGQRVVIQDFVPYGCPGVFHGRITYRPTAGPAGPLSPGGPGPGGSGEKGNIRVGQFSFGVP
jgi:hypothetical protein